METKVKSREWVKTAAIIFLAVLLVLTFFSNTIMNASLPEVAAEQTKPGAINAKIRGAGMLSANETYDVTIAQTRRIGSVKIREGQTVNAGDVLFVLEAEESEEVRQAQEQLAQMELNYEKSLIAAGNTRAQENRQVQKAQEAYNEALAVYNQYSNMEPSRLAAAQAQAEAKLKELQQAYQKAQDELAEAESDEAYLDAQSRYQAAKTELEQLKLQEQEAREKYYDAQSGSKESFIQAAKQEKSKQETLIATLSADKNTQEERLRAFNEEKGLKTYQDAVTAASEALSARQANPDYLLFLNEISKGDSAAMKIIYEDAPLLEQKLVTLGLASGEYAHARATALMTAYDAVVTAQAALEEKQNALTAQEAAFEAELSEITGKLAEIDGKLAQAEQKIKSLDAQLAELNDTQLDYNTLLSQLDAAWDRAIEKRAERERTLATLKKDYDSKSAAIDTQKAAAALAKKQMDDQQSTVDSLSGAAGAAATVKSCEQALEDLIFQQGLDDGSSLDLQSAKEEIEKQKQTIEALRQKSDAQEVTAKVGGVISNVYVTAGNTAGAESPLATINLVDRGYTIKIPVTTEQARKVKIGDRAELVNFWGEAEAVLESLANDPSNPGKGKLLVFRLTGDVEPNQNYTLSIGQKSAKYDCLVPNSAIRSDNNGSFVLVLAAKSTPLSTRYIATRADVQILAADDTSTAVTGLSGGDFVITTSTKPIEAGTQVRLVDNE